MKREARPGVGGHRASHGWEQGREALDWAVSLPGSQRLAGLAVQIP